MKTLFSIGLCTLLTLSTFASTRKLGKAVAAGDLAMVQAELEDGTNPNKDYKDRLPLVHAIELGHDEIVDALLDAKADVNGVQENGETPLLAAIQQLNHKTVEKLVEQGANLDLVTDNGFPLYRAVEMADMVLIDYLREKGANIKQLAKNKENLLFPAVRSGALAITRQLIKLGLDVNHADKAGETPFIAAAFAEDVAMVKLLLFKGAEKNAVDKINRNAMTWAVIYGDHTMVALLSGLGLDIEIVDDQRANAVGYVQFFKAESKRSALRNPLEFMGDGYHQAVMLNDLEALKKMLTSDFNFDRIECPGVCVEKDSDSYPLLFAIRNGNIELIKLLFDHGAPVNRQFDAAKSTPLKEASKKGRIDLVRFLISKGANVNEIDVHMTSALEAAIANKRYLIAKVLWEAGARAYRQTHAGDVIRFSESSFNFKRLEDEHAAFSKKHIEALNDDQLCVPVDGVYPVFCNEVTQPNFTKRVPPIMPRAANLPYEKNASVTLECVLDKGGSVRDIRVLKNTGHRRAGYDLAAIQALRQWEFEPGTVDGEAVNVRMTLKIDFVKR